MGVWMFASKAEHDGSTELSLNLIEGDGDGSVSGTAVFQGRTFNVKGGWAAKGSVTGRNASVFWFGGITADNAPCFLVAAGNINLGTLPLLMDIAVTTADSGDGEDYGYNGRLISTAPPPYDPDDG